MRTLRLPTSALLILVGAWSPAHAGDWPQWRGPDRNDISSEPSGYPNSWPPKLLWSTNVGKGCTSPVLAAGKLYVLGWQSTPDAPRTPGSDTVYCFEAATGKELWTQSYPSPYQARFRTGDEDAYGGPSSTPTYDPETRFLFTLGIDGDLICWDTAHTGKQVWARNLYADFKLAQRPDTGGGARDYGCTSSPLVQGNLLLLEVGQDAGALVAFDKKTGRTLWTSASKEFAGHSGGPVPITLQSVPCLASLTLQGLLVVRADKGHVGQTLAQFPWQTDFACNVPTPAVSGNLVLLASGYNRSESCLLELTLNSVQPRWQSKAFATVSSPVIHGDSAYLIDSSLKCLDLATGAVKWKGGSFDHGSCILTSDHKLLVFGRSNLVLVDARPPDNQYHELARVRTGLRDSCYPHLALSDGIICCKDRAGNLACFTIR